MNKKNGILSRFLGTLRPEVFLTVRYTSGFYVTGNDAILFSGQKKGGMPDMKNDDIELLREVQKNAEMGDACSGGH